MVSSLLPPFRPAKATASAVTPELLACVFVREEFLPAQGHGCLSLTHLPLTCWHACSPISEAVRQLCPSHVSRSPGQASGPVPLPRTGSYSCLTPSFPTPHAFRKGPVRTEACGR